MERTPERETNTAILNQIGQPPPASVLATIMQFTSNAPQHVAAFVRWGKEETTWRVVANLGCSLLEVAGVKEASDWYGGRMEDDGMGDQVTAQIYPLRTLESVHFDLGRAYLDHNGRLNLMTGAWTLAFRGGGTVVLDTRDVAANESTRSAVHGIVQAVHTSC
jgi:hypothetical protein